MRDASRRVSGFPTIIEWIGGLGLMILFIAVCVVTG